MFEELFSSFVDVIVAGLNPFGPVAFVETRWHVLDALGADVGLERVHALNFEVRDVVPAKVNATVVFGRHIMRHLVFPIWNEVVCVDWRHSVRVLLVIARVVRIFGVRVFYRLF